MFLPYSLTYHTQTATHPSGPSPKQVVVAHRLSTIKGANKIAVVCEGAVAELGSHEELIQKPDGGCMCAQFLNLTEILTNNLNLRERVSTRYRALL